MSQNLVVYHVAAGRIQSDGEREYDYCQSFFLEAKARDAVREHLSYGFVEMLKTTYMKVSSQTLVRLGESEESES